MYFDFLPRRGAFCKYCVIALDSQLICFAALKIDCVCTETLCTRLRGMAFDIGLERVFNIGPRRSNIVWASLRKLILSYVITHVL